jgi:hypothetical protein
VRDGSRQPPPLQACVDPAGGRAVQVVPGADAAVCRGLGLVTSPDAGTSPATRRFAAMSRDVEPAFASGRCVSAADGERLVRGALDAHGLDGWRIALADFSAARPCSSLAFDSDRELVTLIGIEPPIP